MQIRKLIETTTFCVTSTTPGRELRYTGSLPGTTGTDNQCLAVFSRR